MKWVQLGIAQAAGFVIVAAWWDKRHRAAILAGGAVAAGLMWWQYQHAMAAGLASPEPGTETY